MAHQPGQLLDRQVLGNQALSEQPAPQLPRSAGLAIEQPPDRLPVQGATGGRQILAEQGEQVGVQPVVLLLAQDVGDQLGDQLGGEPAVGRCQTGHDRAHRLAKIRQRRQAHHQEGLAAPEEVGVRELAEQPHADGSHLGRGRLEQRGEEVFGDLLGPRPMIQQDPAGKRLEGGQLVAEQIADDLQTQLPQGLRAGVEQGLGRVGGDGGADLGLRIESQKRRDHPRDQGLGLRGRQQGRRQQAA